MHTIYILINKINTLHVEISYEPDIMDISTTEVSFVIKSWFTTCDIMIYYRLLGFNIINWY